MDGTVYKTDWRYLDGIVPVTYYSQDAVVENSKARRVSITKQDVQVYDGFGVQSTDAVWYVWPDVIPGVEEPKRGHEIITSDGDRWAVLAATANIVGITIVSYRCLCRRRLDSEREL
jgi:hypothetical protein